MSRLHKAKCSVVSWRGHTNQIIPAHKQEKRVVLGIRLLETRKRFFHLDFEGSQANVKIKTLPEVWNSFLYPKPRARTSVGQKPIQIFQKAFKSQETCTRFKANTENHQPDDFCTVLGRWEDRTKQRELQLSWKAWLKAVTVQGKHL